MVAHADGWMALPVMGAALGLILAGIEAIFLRALARRVDLPETKRVLRIVGVSQFVFFPVLGWFMADAIGGQ